MASFAKRERQRIIDEYLNSTGQNHFVPGEFLIWLKEKPDHQAYGVFFGTSDEDAAWQYRVQQVRGWVSGLRIVVTISSATHHIGRVDVGDYTMPSLISPMSGRKSGGGYFQLADDPKMIAELRQQAALSLESWLDRYAGILLAVGGNPDDIKEIADLLVGVVDAEAAA